MARTGMLHHCAHLLPVRMLTATNVDHGLMRMYQHLTSVKLRESIKNQPLLMALKSVKLRESCKNQPLLMVLILKMVRMLMVKVLMVRVLMVMTIKL